MPAAAVRTRQVRAFAPSAQPCATGLAAAPLEPYTPAVPSLTLMERRANVDSVRAAPPQGNWKPPMPSPSYRKLFWCLVVAGLTLDLGAKYGMFRALWSIS